MKTFKCIKHLILQSGIYVLLSSGLFTFLSLTACLIHENVMLENKFFGVLRARTKLTEQLSYSELVY